MPDLGDEKNMDDRKKFSRWIYKFFETLRKLHVLEKSRYAEPKYVDVLKPLAKFLHSKESVRNKKSRGPASVGGNDYRSYEN